MIKEVYNDVYLGLGSNLGDRYDFLNSAIKMIKQNKQINIHKISSIYETKPFGNPEQNNFLNAVVFITTNLSPENLLIDLKYIEKELGRKQRKKWDSREIDIDILFYGSLIIKNDNINIPHPYIAERDFVLVPMCEIEPNLFHPVLKKKICDICIEEKETFIIAKYNRSIFA